MRLFETLFVVGLLLVLLSIVILPRLETMPAFVYPLLLGVTFSLGIVQLFMEGYRWQFMPAYLIITLLTIHAATHSFQPPVTRPTLIFGLGLLGWLLTVGMSWALPVPTLPAPTGDFAIGTFTVQLKDDSRQEVYGENAGNPREFQLQIWYPAEDVGAEPAPYLDKIELVRPVIGERLGIPSFLLGHLKYTKSHSQPNAPALANDEQFPVLFFVHGYNAFRAQNTHLVETLASQGYVVVAADHTFGTAFTVLDDDRVYLLDPDTIIFDTTQTTIDSGNRLVTQWGDDLDFILETLTVWNANDPQNILTNRLDLSQIGAVGQSTGGAAIVEWCKRDNPCVAGVTLDGWFTPVSEARLDDPANIPMLLMRQEGGMGDIPDGRMRRFYENLTTGYWLTIAGTEHFNFADIPIVSPLANRIGLAGTIDGDYALGIQNDYAVQFFDHYLRGLPAPILETTTPPYPEVTVESITP